MAESGDAPLSEILKSARESADLSQESAEGKLKRLQGEDKSFALKFILRSTFGAIFLVLAVIGFALLRGMPWDSIKDAVNVLLEVLKIAALPLATFVLGQYFGATNK